MARQETGIPFVPPGESPPELTLVVVILGLVLGVIMTAANTYLGLYAGMTVSASIPAAVISMGILRGALRRGTILENNIVQTIASAGESLAAGIIFTMPAMIIAGVWTGFQFWPVTIVAMLGGILGILFMIPLRRALIIEEKELTYPEGIACGEVLIAGETRGSGLRYIFGALGLGAVFKLAVSGITVIQSTVETAWRSGRTAFYFGSDMSVALLGVGFIVGPNVAALVFLGGTLGWVVGIPIYGLVRGLPEGSTILDSVNATWSTQIRYLGVGAMVVGGLWSIIRVREGMIRGVKGAISGYRTAAAGEQSDEPRTDQNLSLKSILGILVPSLIGVLIVYRVLVGASAPAVVAWISMIITSFFFVAVSSYIVGLVGSSNNPVSGMTICTVLFTSALLLLFGMKGAAGIAAALGVAGVVCCAACTAGDISQDLKTGHVVGATPRRQQLAQLLGVLIPAFIIAPVLTLLHHAYGIGTPAREGVEALQAPQATLFANIVRAMFTEGSLPWTMVLIGAALGIALIVIDEYLRRTGAPFRTYVMPVAVGIYLPLSLSVPILMGGVLAAAAMLITRPRGPRAKRAAIHRGVLLGSGLVAGEAVMGILLAAVFSGHEAAAKMLGWGSGMIESGAFYKVAVGYVALGTGKLFAFLRLPVEVMDSGFASLLIASAVIAAYLLIAIIAGSRATDSTE